MVPTTQGLVPTTPVFVPRTDAPTTGLSPIQTNQQPEVYLHNLQALLPGLEIPVGAFDQLKSQIFPSNPNITLATMVQIEEAVKSGLKVCETGIGKD